MPCLIATTLKQDFFATLPRNGEMLLFCTMFHWTHSLWKPTLREIYYSGPRSSSSGDVPKMHRSLERQKIVIRVEKMWRSEEFRVVPTFGKCCQVDVHGLGAVEQLLLEHLEDVQQILQQYLQRLRQGWHGSLQNLRMWVGFWTHWITFVSVEVPSSCIPFQWIYTSQV